MDKLHAQPLDAVLKDLSLTPKDLVSASKEQLTYKQVHKARIGRPISARIKTKIVRALNRCLMQKVEKDNSSFIKEYVATDLFIQTIVDRNAKAKVIKMEIEKK